MLQEREVQDFFFSLFSFFLLLFIYIFSFATAYRRTALVPHELKISVLHGDVCSFDTCREHTADKEIGCSGSRTFHQQL